MGIGISLLLLAVGAILHFAINVTNPSGVNLDTIGVILMIVGGVGVVVSMLFWSRLGFGGERSDTVVVHERELL